KLLHLTAPGAAFFGQKDAQQLALVRRMVEDLNFPTAIVAVPTVREDDGLALFGQKDAQQLALVRRMVEDLNFPTAIVAVPTVREDDGLALSSRNRYLAEPERTHALALSRALRAGEQAAGAGPAAVLRAARDVLDGRGHAAEGLDVDYVALVDPANFREITDAAWQGDAVLAVAARAGRTRLIDNIPLHLGAER
uniref:pantoate--beta-alanine ligase n=1 Tax=Streptomyces sp. PU-14G TaxID=2800808 RepID=UPI0034E01767